MSEPAYNPAEIEPKWQQAWLEGNFFKASEDLNKETMYVLDMFPYPSGDGLHVGHAKIYTASDIVSRYLRLKGFAVLHPTGWDAFGLPTENSAIKFGVHPADLTQKNVDRFRSQMQRLGLSYDWAREVNTTDPTYYKWTQWIFLQLYRMGLAYEDTVPINWCPSCQTGLANEEVTDGKCERCGTVVIRKPMRQWLLRITRYADELLAGLEGLDWPEFIIELQRNWIGKSEGAEVVFPVVGTRSTAPSSVETSDLAVTVFTTRPDTLFGATYVVLAPEHQLVDVITTPQQQAAVTAYREQTARKSDLERTDLAKDKTGVFTGGYVTNPVNNEQLPVWIADYVLMSYGTGAIMAVPAHDERDFAFAQQFELPIKSVIAPAGGIEAQLPYTGEGTLIESAAYNGMATPDARTRITKDMQTKGQGSATTKFKLRDWVFSRQRYWGEPIPIIHCEKCGTVPVPEDQLPVELPAVEKYQPTGTGESPLADIEEWVNVKCPNCPNMARRETNTMPQWAGSSWYFLRFADPKNSTALADPKALQRWLPVDIYIGGAEHAVLHLLYARFWTKALSDNGVVGFREPFLRLRNVGLLMGEDGQKMSKSRGNVVNPDDVIEQYGADTLRVYEMFMGPFEAATPWDTKSIIGSHRFLKRIWDLVLQHSANPVAANAELTDEQNYQLQQTIKQVSESIEQFKFNTAVSSLMELLNTFEQAEALPQSALDTMMVLVSPIAPHIAEELWQRTNHPDSIMRSSWPQFDQAILAQANVTIPVQVNGKVRGTLTVPPGSPQDYIEQQARQLPNVAKYLVDQASPRVIFVPNKLINFVIQQ